MKYFLILVFTFLFLSIFGQVKNDTVQFIVIIDKDPYPGVSIILKGSTEIGAITSAEGIAELIIPHNKNRTELSFIGPYTELKIRQPVDSIIVNFDKSKAKLFYKKKKVNTVKITINDY